MPQIIRSLQKRRERRNSGSFRSAGSGVRRDAYVPTSPRSPRTVVDSYGSEWHHLISTCSWEVLRQAIKEGVGISKSPARQSSKKVRSNSDNASSILLARDQRGDTALHLALTKRNAPLNILVALIQGHPDLASIENKKGMLPLHLAVIHKLRMAIIAELVIANPASVVFADHEGFTPLDFAAVTAKNKKSAIPQESQKWESIAIEEASDQDKRIMEWQEEQNARWAVTKWLLLASASHPRTSLSVGNRQSLLMDALVGAAPPPVISLLTAAGSSAIESSSRGISVACSLLYLCISRQYPSPILKSLAFHSPRQARMVRDETGMGLVCAQYILGCYRKDLDDWALDDRRYDTIQRCIADKRIDETCSWFQDWWDKVTFLLRFCHKDSLNVKEDQLLIAALSNSDTPPSVIKLLLALRPHLASLPDSVTGAHPIHVACMSDTYIPKHYETERSRAMEALVEANPKSVRYRFHGKTPLHLAIESGKTWAQIKPLTSAHRRSLAKRDPTTKLYPFQMVALKRPYNKDDSTKLAVQARNSCSNAEWKSKSAENKVEVIRKMKRKNDLEQVRTCYEFLRRNPSLVKGGIVRSEGVQKVRDPTGMGMVAAHYIVWCYASEKEQWKPLLQNQRVLWNAVTSGRLDFEREDEFENWWTKLKFWIWYCFEGEEGESAKEGTLVMPRTDEYLLHAAVSNSDTPPQIVDLLLSLFPSSASLALPGTDMLPLHIAASTTAYTPRDFEPPYSSAISLLIRSFPKAVRMKCAKRLPLHIAIEANKTWEDLRLLVDAEPRCLRCRDSLTGFYPAQLVAVRHVYTPEQRRRFQFLARNQFEHQFWQKMSSKARMGEAIRLQKEHQQSTLDTVFEFLRRDPRVLDVSMLARGKKKAETTSSARENKLASLPSQRRVEAEAVDRVLSKRSATEQDEDENQFQGSSSVVDDASAFSSIADDASAFSSVDVMSSISSLNGEAKFSTGSRRRLARAQRVPEDAAVDNIEIETAAGKHKPKHMGSPAKVDGYGSRPDVAEDSSSSSENEETKDVEVTPQGVAAQDATTRFNGSNAKQSYGDKDVDVWSYVRHLEQQLQRVKAKSITPRIRDFNEKVFGCTDYEVESSGHNLKSDRSTDFYNDSFERNRVARAPTRLQSSRRQHFDLHRSHLNTRVIPPRDIASALMPTPFHQDGRPVDGLRESLSRASGSLRHIEPTPPERIQHGRPVDGLRESLSRASGSLRHIEPTNPERKHNAVERRRDEVTAVQKRVGAYRSGWTATPEIQKRRTNRFRSVFNIPSAKEQPSDKGLPCLLCGQGRREVLMLPCRHLCLCSTCSETRNFSKCQTCGEFVDSVMRVYLYR